MELRAITPHEQQELLTRGCFAEQWDKIKVSNCFSPKQLSASRFCGEVEIHAGAQIDNSTVKNYSIGQGVIIDRVNLLECTERSSFGNGVEVAALNECGGRKVKIYESLTAQVAYTATTCRHRPTLISKIEEMVERFSEQQSSSMGSIGAGSKIIGAGILRNIRIKGSATIEGSSYLSNGTLLNGAYFGADVKAHDFIAIEGSRVDAGATLERCFVGESAIISNGFTAVDTLFFAMSHCENGEAASVFAGPYTVSHHKSSLLIAGMFSFFNAGSGANQSNHLFNCGPVHQGIHLRGCKLGSSAYVMLPAIDGAFTTVIGNHYSHHDTSKFPFSILMKKDGCSMLIPAVNLISYGYLRDTQKWIARDKRVVKRDVIDMQEYNPYILGALIEAVNLTNSLIDAAPGAESYTFEKLYIDGEKLRQALTFYNKAVAASIGAMLEQGNPREAILSEPQSYWVDAAGQYITCRALDKIIERVEQGTITSLEQIDAEFKAFALEVDDHAYAYALNILTELLGHTPTSDEVESVIKSSKHSLTQLRELAHADMLRDSSPEMHLSYGIDAHGDNEIINGDFDAVRQ